MERSTLQRLHGTPREFAAAVYRAIGEISLDEAERAIRKYQREWNKAATDGSEPMTWNEGGDSDRTDETYANDPYAGKWLECCMCGAAEAFMIDGVDPALGYCRVENKWWRIEPGPGNENDGSNLRVGSALTLWEDAIDSIKSMTGIDWTVCDWREEGEIHIVPTTDEHGRADCWCCPDIHPTKGEPEITIYVHNVKQ